MSLRRRSSSKPSTSRGWNKVRLANRHDVTEIESWVDFASQSNSNDEENKSIIDLNKIVDSFFKTYDNTSCKKKIKNRFGRDQDRGNEIIYFFNLYNN